MSAAVIELIAAAFVIASIHFFTESKQMRAQNLTRRAGQRTISVLVVDNDNAERYRLARELRKCGFIVDDCVTVKHALAFMAESTYSVVFSDIRFQSDSDCGDYLHRAIVRKYPATPVVMLSSVMDSNVRAKLISDGALVCLQKPVLNHHCLMAISTAASYQYRTSS